jgi:hypothetical protein
MTRVQLAAALVFAGYVAISFRIGEVFPFARYPMFDRTSDQASRLVARTTDGVLHEVSEFDNWTCTAVTPPDAACGSGYPELEERVRAELRRRGAKRPDAIGEAVEVIRNQYFAQHPEGPMLVRQCSVLMCTAVRAR